MSGWDVARFGWLLACTLAASVTDVRERRIPNWLVLVCAAATPIWVATGILSWSDALIGGVLMSALFLVPALVGKAGMGDVKLAFAIGLGAGVSTSAVILVGTAIAMLVTVSSVWFWARRTGRAAVKNLPLAPLFVVGLSAAALGHRFVGRGSW